MGAVTKADLARLLFDHIGMNKREAADFVDAIFEEMIHQLGRGENVKLSGFGTFLLYDKRQRPGRNPKTGDEIPVSARRVVAFHSSQKMKKEVDQANVSSSTQ